ncbi:MAG TPA: hypothetical protein VJH63_04375 [Candidatus Paceibacterota bacterium]
MENNQKIFLGGRARFVSPEVAKEFGVEDHRMTFFVFEFNNSTRKPALATLKRKSKFIWKVPVNKLIPAKAEA